VKISPPVGVQGFHARRGHSSPRRRDGDLHAPAGSKAAHKEDDGQGAILEADGSPGEEISPPVVVHEPKARPKVDYAMETLVEAPLLPAKDPPTGSEALVSDPAEGDVTVARMMEGMEQRTVDGSHDHPIGSVEAPVPAPVQGSDRNMPAERHAPQRILIRIWKLVIMTAAH
jgi:hypothetical protein